MLSPRFYVFTLSPKKTNFVLQKSHLNWLFTLMLMVTFMREIIELLYGIDFWNVSWRFSWSHVCFQVWKFRRRGWTPQEIFVEVLKMKKVGDKLPYCRLVRLAQLLFLKCCLFSFYEDAKFELRYKIRYKVTKLLLW